MEFKQYIMLEMVRGKNVEKFIFEVGNTIFFYHGLEMPIRRRFDCIALKTRLKWKSQ